MELFPTVFFFCLISKQKIFDSLKATKICIYITFNIVSTLITLRISGKLMASVLAIICLACHNFDYISEVKKHSKLGGQAQHGKNKIHLQGCVILTASLLPSACVNLATLYKAEPITTFSVVRGGRSRRVPITSYLVNCQVYTTKATLCRQSASSASEKISRKSSPFQLQTTVSVRKRLLWAAWAKAAANT